MSAGMIVLAFFLGLIIVLVLITLHELGHFIVAKLSNAYVYEFSIGFGPRIFTWKGKETWLSIRIFPLGGYCSIASDKSDPPNGREEEDENIPPERKMEYIARWKKAFFILAGPFVNLIIAIFLVTTIFAITQYKQDDMSFYGAKYSQDQIAYNLIDQKINEINKNKTISVELPELSQQYVIWGWEVIQVKANSLDDTWEQQQEHAQEVVQQNNSSSEKIIWNNIDIEEKANNELINTGDSKKASTYEKTVYNFLDNLNFTVEDGYISQIRFMVKYVDKYDGNVKEVNNYKQDYFLTNWSTYYNPDSQQIDFKSEFRPGNSVGIAAPTRYFKNSAQAYAYGWKDTFNMSLSILESFGKVFTGQFSQLSGPVGVAQQTAGKIQSPEKFFLYVAEISANLFILNMIFIPPLDGYRFIENIIEMIIRKELPQKLKIVLYSIGAILFIGLFATVTILDFI